MTDDNVATPPKGGLSYSYRPSLLGAPWSFRLTDNAIVSEKGRHSTRTPFASIARVRMSFRPVSMQSKRFLTEIWAHGSPRLTICSVSWKSMVEQQRLDAAYVAFVTELHRRLVRSGTSIRFEAGINPFVFWFGVAVATATALTIAALTVRALQAHSLTAAVFISAFFLVFVWQSGNYLRRNRPGRYRPDALPAELLPRPRD